MSANFVSPKKPKIPRTRRSYASSSDEPKEFMRRSGLDSVVNDASADLQRLDGPAQQFTVPSTAAFMELEVFEEELDSGTDGQTDGQAISKHGSHEATNGRMALPVVHTYTNFEVFLTVVSILSYVFDVGSDIYVAVMYYRYGDIWWFTLTVLFIVVPSLTITIFSFVWYIQDRGNHVYPSSSIIWLPRLVLLFFQLGPLLRFVCGSIFCRPY